MTTTFKLQSFTVQASDRSITLRCPACRHLGTFDPVDCPELCFFRGELAIFLGHRRCPNQECSSHLFVAYDQTRNVLVSYPPERLDFDSTSIPPAIVESLEESITCHASGAFVAAAIMVRRMLEDLCADKNAEGDDLKQRIAALGANVVLPPGLLSGMTDLRLLGNDAVHVESQVYNTIGKEEVELAIDVGKEVLKAVYQLDNLVDRLAKLKQPNP